MNLEIVFRTSLHSSLQVRIRIPFCYCWRCFWCIEVAKKSWILLQGIILVRYILFMRMIGSLLRHRLGMNCIHYWCWIIPFRILSILLRQRIIVYCNINSLQYLLLLTIPTPCKTLVTSHILILFNHFFQWTTTIRWYHAHRKFHTNRIFHVVIRLVSYLPVRQSSFQRRTGSERIIELTLKRWNEVKTNEQRWWFETFLTGTCYRHPVI